MNQSTSIRQIVLIAALAVFSLLAGPVMAAESGSQRYIVILKSRTGPVPDLAHLGGTVTFRQDDEVIVTLPPSALPSLRADPLVRYVQSVAGSDPGTAPLAGEPDEPTAGAPRRLVPHATAGPLSWSKQYTYDDAGNIINIGSQQFVYDALGRLNEMATAGSTTESYVYDRYGNQTSRTTSAGVQAMNTEPTTNRLSSGYGYDVAGNVTSGEGYVLAYDPLGQTATKTYTGTTTTFNETYIYTAGDERIGVQTSKSSETSSWWYWSVRDESGKVLRQYRSSANDPTQAALWIEDYVYRDGQLVGAERPPTLGGRRHFHLDHLGSPRLITSDAGLIVSTHDYLPFGGESSVFTETQAGFDREDPMKYTGHERDYAGSFGREDGHAIDYMHARYYNGGLGRFLSVDSVGGNAPESQSWNRYAYARNNPVNLTDPDGRNPLGILVGGLISVTIESVRQINSGEPVNNRKLIGALAGGLVSGGFGGAGGSALRSVLAMGALGGAAGGTVDRLIKGETTTTKAVLIDATGGAVGNLVGHVAGNSAVEGSRVSGELEKLGNKAAVERAESTLANAGLGADKATLQQATQLKQAFRGAGAAGGNVAQTVIDSEGNAVKNESGSHTTVRKPNDDRE